MSDIQNAGKSISIDQQSINTIRFLAADAVEQARSGHPGTPMGAAPLTYVLWNRFLRHNPSNPHWPNRDRFVLSPGHASMLLYALLHLTGYDLSLDELRRFRQWESATPGHPEYGQTPGVEVTTGPLGQGFAHAVGMAMGERHLAARYNRPGHEIIDHFTYALVSDGDLQEGVASEAASLAGTLELGKLIFLYDDNGIQIEGSTRLAFTENVVRRFEAYGWQVLGPIDGMDLDALEAAIADAQANPLQPSLIVCKTTIGYGSPQQGTAKVHGEPLGEANLQTAKLALGWPAQPAFFVPDAVRLHMGAALSRGVAVETAWNEQFDAFMAAYPADAAQLRAALAGELPADWDKDLAALFPDDAPAMATREASGKVLNALAQRLPTLFGGSADLAPSTKTLLAGRGDFAAAHYAGQNLHFGVREHAMGAIANGLALHGGVIPYTATFLTFADYMRPPMRLAALMGIRAIYVFTHDSIGLGEDGPTHQPIEHLMTLRSVPNLTVVRPADARETAQAWREAIRNERGPTALVLSRQNLPLISGNKAVEGVGRGAYILWQSNDAQPDVLLIATGSEVAIALAAAQQLADEGVNVRLVSMPSWELFDRQPAAYRHHVLPPTVRTRVAVEAGQVLGWEHYVGLDGAVVGMRSFGASAPASVLYERFGITPAAIATQVKNLLAGRR